MHVLHRHLPPIPMCVTYIGPVVGIFHKEVERLDVVRVGLRGERNEVRDVVKLYSTLRQVNSQVLGTRHQKIHERTCQQTKKMGGSGVTTPLHTIGGIANCQSGVVV